MTNVLFNNKNPREAAFVASLASAKGEGFVPDLLAQWRSTCSPTDLDFDLASEIAFGSTRMALACDYMSQQLSEKRPGKLRERVLLRTAIYQFNFMSRVPPYAIVNESIEIAKKYCHYTFVSYLNALLRKLEKEKLELPQGDSVEELSVRYSYPSFFVKLLIEDYGLTQAKIALEAGNVRAPVTYRIRTTGSFGVIEDRAQIPEIAASTEYYIQNVTPSTLMTALSQGIDPPRKILDLCASPGGKLLLAHDLFPEAKLFANDVSEEKVKLLLENCSKYGIQAELSCERGEEYWSSEKFDIVVLDVPCSNSGVLNKRPEARWRLTEENLDQLEELQLNLIRHAITLLAPGGEIWYLTCSILKRENEQLMQKAGLSVRQQQSILPNLQGIDGGFACALKNSP